MRSWPALRWSAQMGSGRALLELASDPAVIVLAAAASHTEQSAIEALQTFGYRTETVASLDRFGFLVHAGTEWRVSSDLRTLVGQIAGSNNSVGWLDAHQHYFEIAVATPALDDPNASPRYLRTGPGYAYHGTEISRSDDFQGYRGVALIESLAVSVEALKLAEEQVDRAVPRVDGLDFLRAMTLYRSGQQSQAVELLRPLAASSGVGPDVAVAQHLVARWDCKWGDDSTVGSYIHMFRKSRANAVARQDTWHRAQVEHSMAICMLRRSEGDREAAINLLRHSLDLLSEVGDTWGRAMVLHTLGQAEGRTPRQKRVAQAHLRESRELGAQLGYTRHVEMVSESLDRLGRATALDRKLKRKPKDH